MIIKEKKIDYKTYTHFRKLPTYIMCIIYAWFAWVAGGCSDTVVPNWGMDFFWSQKGFSGPTQFEVKSATDMH